MRWGQTVQRRHEVGQHGNVAIGLARGLHPSEGILHHGLNWVQGADFIGQTAQVAHVLVRITDGKAVRVVVALHGPFHEGVVKAVAHATAANHRMKLLGTQSRLARDAQRL